MFLLILPVALAGIAASAYNHHLVTALPSVLILTLAVFGLYRDFTLRGREKNYRELGREVLQILNEPGDLHDAVQLVIAAFKARTGFDAVGIRLQEGEDFPYSAQKGFSPEFLSTENALIAREAGGGICRDRDGKAKLECTCGMVLRAQTGKSHPFLTRGGSFWTNNSRSLLKIPPGQDPRLHPRNRCTYDGYASVALVPIRSKDTVVGLIHLNDRRKKRFTLETVELLEGIASSIGSALMRKRLEATVRESEEKYRGVFESGFDPVLFVDGRTGRIESANAAALQMYGYAEDEMLALKTEALATDAEKARECLAGVVAGRTKGVVTGFRHKKKDGTEFPVEISASRCAIGGQVKVIAAVHDTTRRLRDAHAAARAAAEVELLQAREAMVTEMMATVSHEMRTPLAAIKGFRDLALRRPRRQGEPPDFSNDREARGAIEAAVEDMLLMTDLTPAKPRRSRPSTWRASSRSA